MSKIKILFVAAELTPLAKVGGLGDVIGALPKSLLKAGLDVRIVIPKYGIVEEKKYPLRKVAENIEVPFNSGQEKINIYLTDLPGSRVPVYLIDNYKYLGENGIYFEKDASSGGSTKECQRFTFFARAVFESLRSLNFWPDIIHCHDWHVGIVPFLLKWLGNENKKFQSIKTHLTIHNLAYQGKYNYQEVLGFLNLKEEKTRGLGLKKFDDETINYLQQAILFTDSINTVSPTYAQEILTPEFGENLEKDLQARKNDLRGVLNGIDLDRFNPETDPDIIKNYSLKNIEAKNENKKDLQKITGLKIDENIPLLGSVGRLTEQKGIELIEPILERLVHKNFQLVILGTGVEEYEKIAQKMAKDFPGNVYVKIAFDAPLAQKIYAGSDIFLMPSHFEPCGLGQMIAMRYGTIPIVRATGGLKDTVIEYNSQTNKGTGFRFDNFDSSEFQAAVEKALKIYKNKDEWQNIIKNAMSQDFSWDRSSQEYIKLYKKLIS